MEIFGRPRRLSRLHVRNLRGFDDLRLDFDAAGSGADGTSSRPRQASVVIGRNGTNKTTLLRSIVLGLADPSDASALLAEPNGSLVRHRRNEGKEEEAETRITVTLAAIDDPSDTITFSKEIVYRSGRDQVAGFEGSASDDPGIFVVGYGQNRFLTGPDSGRSYRILDSTKRLFDYKAELIDPEVTLRRLHDYQGDEFYESVTAGIKRVLGMEEGDSIGFSKGGGVELLQASSGERIPLEGWADGHRSTFTWLLDLYGWAMRADRVDPDGHVIGTVLLDEVGQHLHPSLQASVMPLLKELLPHVQFVVTTHSPIVALGAEPSELIVLRRNGDRVETAGVPDFRGYTVEDMVADADLFDSDPVAPSQRKDYDRYIELVKRGPAAIAESEAELSQLVSRLDRRLITPADDRLRPKPSDEEILASLRKQSSAS